MCFPRPDRTNLREIQMGLDGIFYLAFLGCVAGIQALLPERGRVALLLCASLVFYAFSNATHLVMLFALCAVNYGAVCSLARNSEERLRTLVFASTVILDLLVLICFKYTSGLVGQLLAKFGWHEQSGGIMRIAAPLGLSYFTFQMVACVTDAYRKTWQVSGGFQNFALFGLFFPQITSGPIPRAGSLLPQLAGGGTPSAEDRLAGARMIAFGFFKIYVVASRLAEYVDSIFKKPPESNFAPSLIASCFSVMQLYADFSGCVDIAIGSARFLGIRLDPNFDHPFSATSVTGFWRRWHMTLTGWLRDYLYMPLVIRLRNFGKPGIAVGTIVTFAICGIWHGAAWTFLLFGIAQGVAMTAELLTKSWRTKKLRKVPERLVDRLGNLYLLAFFVLSDVLFRSANLSQALDVYSHIFRLHISGGIGDFLGTRPFSFALDCAGIAAWMGVGHLYSKTSDRMTPWFVALCASLILLLGCVGSAHFIYAAF